MPTFTKRQPKAGETILHCGYLATQQWVWFSLHGDRIDRCVRGDGVWSGAAPAIKEATSS